VRLFELADAPDQAVRVLHEVEPKSILAKRDLARRLVDMTRAAIDQQSTIVLQNTERTLEGLNKTDQTTLATAQRRMNQVRQFERQRRAEVFSIAQPRGEPSATTSP
jgi:hypothetical protein